MSSDDYGPHIQKNNMAWAFATMLVCYAVEHGILIAIWAVQHRQYIYNAEQAPQGPPVNWLIGNGWFMAYLCFRFLGVAMAFSTILPTMRRAGIPVCCFPPHRRGYTEAEVHL